MRLFEAVGKQVVVVYPGRFQVFHKGHKAVYDHLTSKYNNVYITTSDKVDPPKSPFSFEEKKKMMELTGMDTANVVLTKQPYIPNEVTQNFNKENTILLIAVSEKDMAEDPRFTFKPKKDGSPSYFQANPEEGQLETMDKHGYIITVPTFDFKVLGKSMKSASEIRSAFSSMDNPTQQELITDLFGSYSPEVHSLMASKITSDLKEGGWEDTLTQQTVLTPDVVKTTLKIVKKFTSDFNKWLKKNKIPPVEMGAALGSTAYHKVDAPDTEYGDVDLQMIAPNIDGMTGYKLSKYYNEHIDSFLNATKPNYYHDRGKPNNGHPIFNIGNDAYVQVDMLWTTQDYSNWDQYRKTPVRGIKGLITGNLFSTLGEVINMSLQTAVLMKIKDGEPINYQRGRKADEVVEVTRDIKNFGLDILKFVYNAVNGSTKGIVINDMLKNHPGVNTADIQIEDIAKTVKGLFQGFEDNGLYGKYNLKDYSNKEELQQKYLEHYLDKADRAGKGAKLDKAETPEELAKVQELRDKIAKGVKIVKQAFNEGSIKEAAQRDADYRRVFGGIDGDIVDAIEALTDLFSKVRSAPGGTKVRPRLLIKLQNVINMLKQQMDMNLELRENKENKNMSAQKIGVFTKGRNKVSLWEHNGQVVLVDKTSKRLQESKGSVAEAVDSLYNKGYVCESVDITTMKNAAGALMRVFFDTVKNTTTVRDDEGGSRTYNAKGDKVIAALQKKGFKQEKDDFSGLSLVPTDAERQKGLI